MVDGSATIRAVQIEGLVALKIAKHASESAPSPAVGQLLGLDVDNCLEVTNCFPTPADQDETATSDMMRLLREVHVDHVTVGWYQTAPSDTFVTKDVVTKQYEFQSALPNSVLLVFDPSRTRQGTLALRALRLRPGFVRCFDEDQLDQAAYSAEGLAAMDIWEELPIKLHNSHLVHAYLYELREAKSMNAEFDRLKFAASSSLCDNMRNLSRCSDDFTQETYEYQRYQRQVQRSKERQRVFLAEHKKQNEQRAAIGQPELPPVDESTHPLFKPVPPPRRLSAHLLVNQMGQFCDQLSNTVNQSFHKLFIAQALQKSTPASHEALAAAEAAEAAEDA